MKINIVTAILAVLIAGLIAYMVYYIASGHENDILCGILSFVCLASTLIPMVSLRHEEKRLTVNLKVISSLGFIILFLLNLGFATFGVVMPYYLVIVGVLLIVYVLAYYKLSRIKNI